MLFGAQKRAKIMNGLRLRCCAWASPAGSLLGIVRAPVNRYARGGCAGGAISMGVLRMLLRRSALRLHAKALLRLPMRKRNGLQPCGLRVRSVFTMRRRCACSSFSFNHLDSHAKKCSGGRGAAESPRFLHGGVAGGPPVPG